MPAIGFDKKSINHELLLGLPFREGINTLVFDRAKPHHRMTQHDPGGGSFVWGNLVTGCPYLQFIMAAAGGVTDGVYLECPAADTIDLNFTTGDYSIGGWFNWTSGTMSQMVAGRYVLDNNGWELYLYDDPNYYLSVRHNHAGGAAVRSGAYSPGWIQNTWHFMGISRIGGGQAVFYRNGLPLPTVSTLEDPETCNQDLVIGARFTRDSNWFNGMMWNLRIWGRNLAAEEWRFIYNCERHWFN